LSDVQTKGTTMNGESAASLGDDANLLMLIQVPLKVRTMRQQPPAKAMEAPPAPPSAAAGLAARDREAMETAVLGHGPELGPFVELDGKTIARDPRFPVRVTAQFYQ